MTERRQLRRRGPRGALVVGGLGLALALAPVLASAQVSVGGKAGTGGVSGGASGPKKKKGGFELPERVVGGNAISALLPVEVGLVGYLPRVRIGFQYDRQIYKAHWIYVGAAALLDRGDWRNFKLSDCGLQNTSASCDKGTVAGFDVYLGYAHKWFLREYPFLVPIARGGLGGGYWALPKIGGSREQYRSSQWTLNLRGGGGLRLFLLQDLAIGLDVNFVLGFTISKDQPVAVREASNTPNFLLGMEILPLIVEYRF